MIISEQFVHCWRGCQKVEKLGGRLVYSCHSYFRFLFNKLWGWSTSSLHQFPLSSVDPVALHCYSRYHYYLSLYLDMSTRNWIHIEVIDMILFTKLNWLVIIIKENSMLHWDFNYFHRNGEGCMGNCGWQESHSDIGKTNLWTK